MINPVEADLVKAAAEENGGEAQGIESMGAIEAGQTLRFGTLTGSFIDGVNKMMVRPGVAKGSVSVIDFTTRKVEQTWPIPGGGSPDMGNVSADGKYLWLSGRFDDVVYRIDTTSGGVDKIKVGKEPHGLTVWPQPGRYSLGHTGNLR